MDKQIIKKFRETIRKFEREVFFLNNDSCCNTVTLAQCHTLMEIESNKSISVSELANNMSLDKSTVSRTIEGLVNKDLISREIPQNNRRTTSISLTRDGKKTCKDINTRNDKYFQTNLSVLTPDEQNEFMRLMAKITNQMVLMRKKGLKG